jgi:hypothetical protein
VCPGKVKKVSGSGESGISVERKAKSGKKGDGISVVLKRCEK